MSYAMLGTEDGIRITLDRYFAKVQTTQPEPKENTTLSKKANLSGKVYDLKGRAVSTPEESVTKTTAAGMYFSKEKKTEPA